jgi:hypothetical protein
VDTKARWICSYADSDHKPCNEPALWIIERGELRVGACHPHRQAIVDSLTPEIRILNIEALTALKGKRA